MKRQSTVHHSSLENLPSPCVTCKSNASKGVPMNFKDDQTFDWSDVSDGNPKMLKKQPSTHHSSLEDLHPPCVSCKSNASKGDPMNFKDDQKFDWSSRSCPSGLKGDRPLSRPLNFNDPSSAQHSSLHGLHSPEDLSSLTSEESKERKCFPYYSLKRNVSAPTGHSREFLPARPNFHRSSQSLHPATPDGSPVSMTSDKDIDSSFENSFQSAQESLSPKYDTFEQMNLNQSYQHPSKDSNPSPLLSPGSDCSFLSDTSELSMDSPRRMERPSSYFSIGCQTQLNPILMDLKGNIIPFVENELQKFNNILQKKSHEWSPNPKHVDAAHEIENEKAFLKIALNFLRQMNQNELADMLQSETSALVFQHRLKQRLSTTFQNVFEGIAKAGNPASLKDIYTELHISEQTTEVDEGHEVRQFEAVLRKPHKAESTVQYNNIFKVDRHHRIRTVLTKGAAGIGKTVLTQKFTLDWAEGKANQDKHFVFPFTFRQLNLLKDKPFTLVELIHHFFSESKDDEISSFQDMNVVFILDGLDECRLPLDFHKSKDISSVNESATVDELLVNLIKGNLLPSVQIWITTRPGAARQIPAQCISLVTEVQGFLDSQKEQYFKNKFPDDQAPKVISHIKSSPSLYAMCYLPIFCWILATILQNLLKIKQVWQLPKTLTEMYIHFLVVQAKVKNVKFDNKCETDEPWSLESSDMIKSLGKLAFEQLMKRHLIFYESDLNESGINIIAASVYSGVFTELFKEERGLYQDKVYCFVHLSMQEFLAAFHVHLTFFDTGVNLLSENQSPVKSESAEVLFYQTAIDKAFQSHNGHLDLFLRFLIGLSVVDNQILLRGLLPKSEISSNTNKEIIQIIKEKLNENVSIELCINLFHCLAELKDRSIVNQIQWRLSTGQLNPNELSPSQWSALVFILLSSEREQFDLKDYLNSEQGLKRLLPVVKISKKAILSGCHLTKESCRILSTLLRSKSCCLKELDLSNNDLMDVGIKELEPGLISPYCKLEILRLSGCVLTEEGCIILASALKLGLNHLKVLDVSYNHPGNKGLKALKALKTGQSNLETLSLTPTGPQYLMPGRLKYFTKIPLDPNTAHRNLQLLDYNKKVEYTLQEIEYAEHPDRFDFWYQVLSSEPLSNLCYQEVEWTGEVYIGTTYRRLQRKKKNLVCTFGENDHSWGLKASSRNQCYMCHNSKRFPIKPFFPNRVGIFLDHTAGVLSFFSVSPEERRHLGTFNTTFTDPLYLGFHLVIELPHLVSSASLCDLSHNIPAVFSPQHSPIHLFKK